ncbi:MAG: aromatic hydrocarbon degradation protein, partial [Planctomycetes bacterium]|nr:aromatic hydrocarbon degradation protein [Planctomycetota bacterium]
MYKATDTISLGATYVSPQEVKYDNVFDLDDDGSADDIKIESPSQVGIGVAFEPIERSLLVELDAKWLNWADANGYDDFDWDDQWVIALGARFKPMKKLSL